MIDHGRWINTLPIIKNKDFNDNTYSTNPNKWTDTIPKKKTKNGVKKFSFTLVLFVIGLILVSTIKNKTRNLQKDINNLQASISNLEKDLYKATLDYEVITSPANISQLAEKYLETELVYYKKSQIEKLNEKVEKPIASNVTKNSQIKFKVAQKIKEKKIELQKLKELYKQPEKIPDEIRVSLAKRIEKKKVELKRLYQNPTESINMNKIQQWGALQLVKAFLGVPMIPGK